MQKTLYRAIPRWRHARRSHGRSAARPAGGEDLHVRARTAIAVLVMAGPLYAAAGGALPADPDAYLRYAHPTVREPFADGVSLAVPPDLGDPRTAALGLADVTKAPFNADPTGARDATEALQQAVDFARDRQMVCFFPPGIYRISDTLTCVQQLYRRANGRVFGAHLWPCVLVGSRAGAERPRILLAPGSPGFGDPRRPKIMVHFWARGYANPTTADRVSDGLGPEVEQPNISMNQMLVNLDLVVGENNPGAIAVRHQAAEGSAIEDCTIDATHGLTGIQGGIGSGGGSAGVTVKGGRVGLDFTGYLSGTQPTPTITSFTLCDQTEAAIRSTSRQTLVAAGLRILSRGCAGPLIQVGADSAANQGELTLVDSEVVFDAAATGGPDREVVASTHGVCLRNVYVRGATIEGFVDAPPSDLPGEPDGWLRVREYAHSCRPRMNQGHAYRYPVYIDGRRVEGVREVERGAVPPPDLQSRHLWATPFPGFESPGAANVKAAPYFAKGDGRTDDTAALQQAIDRSEIVFLPKGYYRITRPLELRPRTRLVGVAQHLSVLVATAAEGGFADPERPAPLVRTADDARADTMVAFCGLWAPHNLAAVYALHWRSGGRSVFRAVEISHAAVPLPGAEGGRGRTPPVPRSHPLVVISGCGGGRWYNFREGGEYPQARGYRHLMIEDAAGPLAFYQLSPQHVSSEAAVELRRAGQVSVFGTKYEGSSTMLCASDCTNLCFFGHGGNGKPVAGGALFRFERCADFLVANAVDGPTKIGSRSLSHREGATDPREWNMLVDRPTAGPEIRTEPLERPVLYRRGRPTTSR